jgi:hypothetical protein
MYISNVVMQILISTFEQQKKKIIKQLKNNFNYLYVSTSLLDCHGFGS